MKYNPKVNEEVAAMDGFANIHPNQDPETIQGALQLMYELQEYLKEVTELDAVTLQPAAGAHGELAVTYFQSLLLSQLVKVTSVKQS